MKLTIHSNPIHGGCDGEIGSIDPRRPRIHVSNLLLQIIVTIQLVASLLNILDEFVGRRSDSRLVGDTRRRDTIEVFGTDRDSDDEVRECLA